MDVFRQRLEDEHDASIIITAPTVPYKGNKYSTFHWMIIDIFSK